MQTVSLKTNQLKSRRKAEIDDHIYTVRRLGNIEQIDYSNYLSRILELGETEKERKLTKDEELEIKKLSDNITSLLVLLFDDGGDQSKSLALVKSLDQDDIAQIITQVFSDETTT